MATTVQTECTTSAADELKFRGDLKITERETPDGIAFIILDPAANRFCQFGEIEYAIAQQCDGDSSLDQIRRRVESRFNVSLPDKTLAQFVEKLRTLNLLKSDDPATTPKPPDGRVQGNTLYLRVKLFDPDRLLGRLLGPLGFVYTRAFFCLSIGSILAAGAVAIANHHEIIVAIGRLWQFNSLWLAIVVFTFAIVLHEFAHGLTCKRFGGSVPEIGLLLLYFMPGFYCNVSHAWQFRKKSHRMWVTFAGAWLDLNLWAAAIFCWRITHPDTWVNKFALLLMATAGLWNLFNLNPLLKLDGYYLLSDWLEIPNLRQQSSQYLGRKIGGVMGVSRENVTVPRRCRVAFIVFGTLAASYSAAVLAVVVFKLGDFLMTQFHAVGFLVFTSAALALLRRPLMYFVSWTVARIRQHFTRFGHCDQQPAHCQESASNVSQRSGQNSKTNAPGDGVAQRILPRIPWPLKAAVALVLTGTVLFFGRWELSVVGDVEVLASERAVVRATVDGVISNIHVLEGCTVEAGEVIAQLCDRTYQMELEQVNAEIARNAAELSLLKAGPKREDVELAHAKTETAKSLLDYCRRGLERARKIRSEQLQRAEAVIDQAESKLQFASAAHERYQTLLTRRAVSEQEVDASENELRVQQAFLTTARSDRQLLAMDNFVAHEERAAMAEARWSESLHELKLLHSAPRRQKLEAAEAEIARLKARRRFLEDMIQRTIITSPIAGTVTTRHIEEKQNSNARLGETIAEVQDSKTVRVELSISEKEYGDVALDSKVDVKVYAYPNQIFRGKVITMTPAAFVPQGQEHANAFVVTTLLSNESRLLKPGMTGKAKIRRGPRSLVNLATRKLSHYVRIEFWSWW